jgi:hypothetical protein
MNTKRQQLEQILHVYTDAIQRGDMILDVKEMETLPALEAMITECERLARLAELKNLKVYSQSAVDFAIERLEEQAPAQDSGRSGKEEK